VAEAKKLGYPLVMKVTGPVHKPMWEEFP